MKLKLLLTAAMALAVSANFAVAADDDTPLNKEMTALNKSLRTLKRQAADASKKAENLELVAKMKANVQASLKYEPVKTKDQPPADKPTYLEKYKKEMGELDKLIDELKAGIEKGDADATAKTFEKLADLKEKAHKVFNPDE
jgi:soluble cytochrome b562